MIPLDASTVWVLIPVCAIVLGIGSGIISILSKTLQAYFVHKEQMATLKTDTRATSGPQTHSDLLQLQAEVARLRDTTTQYDLSIQHTLDEVQKRLATLESSGVSYRPANPSVSAQEQDAQNVLKVR